MYEYEIEAATAADAPQISALVDLAYRHYIGRMGQKPGPMLDDYAVMIRDHGVWVMRDGDQLMAVLVLIDKPEMMLLDNIAVHPAYQGRKLGKQLMAWAESEGRRRGYQAIQLYTNSKMVENIAIYKKLGYEIFAQKQERGFERVYMKKEL